MTAAAPTRSADDDARLSPDPPLLDEFTAGRSVSEIAARRNQTRERTERLLRVELKAISIRPARDYAKIQIRRLEAMIGKLTEKANQGDVAAVDRVLKIADRLDRYHDLVKTGKRTPEFDERDDEAFDRKIADLRARAEAKART